MNVIELHNWKISIVLRDRGTNHEHKKPLFSGFDKFGRKHLFFVRFYDLENEYVVGYRNCYYKLMKPNDKFAKSFPNPKNNFFNTLRERHASKTQRVQKSSWWIDAIHALASLWAIIRTQNSPGGQQKKNVCHGNARWHKEICPRNRS